MSVGLLQRVVALAAVAFAAAVGALALTSAGTGAGAAPREARPVPAPGGGWYTALAGSRGEPSDGERTTCHLVLTGRSLGVTHPVLPCGALIYVGYGSIELLTEVIDTKLKEPGRQIELTEVLAQRLGLDGTQEIRWRFATRG